MARAIAHGQVEDQGLSKARLVGLRREEQGG
jgi:hypothetical protein